MHSCSNIPSGAVMQSRAERVAALAFSSFEKLPKKCKPRTLSDGRREWTPMSAVILAQKLLDGGQEKLTCISIATGTKCLPFTVLPDCRGSIVHDSHAEVLALRGLNRFLLSECRATLTDEEYVDSPFINRNMAFVAQMGKAGMTNPAQLLKDMAPLKPPQIAVVNLRNAMLQEHATAVTRQDVPNVNSLSSVAQMQVAQLHAQRHARLENQQAPSFQRQQELSDQPQQNTSDHNRPFHLNPNITIHLFTTSPPCGDVSMDILVASRPDNSMPWTETSTLVTSSLSITSALHGHEYFDQLGRVRLKPSRADAAPTQSKSCTDKLALKQFTGTLSFPADVLIEQVWLDSIVVPASAYHEIGWRRAFGADGRLKNVNPSTDLPVKFFGVQVLPATFPEFKYAKPSDVEGAKVGNVAALCIRRAGLQFDQLLEPAEVLINGVKQGFKQSSENHLKQSAVCRVQMWGLGKEIMGLIEKREMVEARPDFVNFQNLKGALQAETYGIAKRDGMRARRREIKSLVTSKVGGWFPNEGDDGWAIEKTMDGNRGNWKAR